MNRDSKTVFIFPGQGAQYVGMAKEFVENFSIARETFEEADDILGRKLSTIILSGPEPILMQTKNSQVAIFVASAAIFKAVRQCYPEIVPSICAGLSLGEYTALYASGRISFSDALQLVQKRGDFMNDACEAFPGAMSVILGMKAEDVEAIVREISLPNDLWAANFNSPGQVVISGTHKGIEAASEVFKAKGAKRIVPLAVHGAFHSGLMQSARERLAEHVTATSISDSAVELVMNVPGDFVAELSAVRNHLISQVTLPVRWQQGIEQIEKQGVDLYMEIGCGKTLSGFNKRIGVKAPTIGIENIAELKYLEHAGR